LKALCTIALILPLTANAGEAVDAVRSCESAPAEAIVKLDPPYSLWFAIECDGIRKAHFAVAGRGYTWTEVNTGEAYRFNAYGPISPTFSPIELNTYEPHKYYFVKAVPSVMTQQQLAGVNKLLPEGVTPYATIHQLDLNTKTKKIYSFFIYLNSASPEWIAACVNYQCGTRATIRVTKK